MGNRSKEQWVEYIIDHMAVEWTFDECTLCRMEDMSNGPFSELLSTSLSERTNNIGY